MRSLLRLTTYLRQYAWSFWLAMAGMVLSRVFEGVIPLYVKMGIDGIAGGQAAIAAGSMDQVTATAALVYPATAIAFCVVLQMLATIGYRIASAAHRRQRRLRPAQPALPPPAAAGPDVLRPLRGRRSDGSCHQRHQSVPGDSRRHHPARPFILFITAVVGIFFMFSLSVKLTLAILAPMPVIAFVAYLFLQADLRSELRGAGGVFRACPPSCRRTSTAFAPCRRWRRKTGRSSGLPR